MASLGYSVTLSGDRALRRALSLVHRVYEDEHRMWVCYLTPRGHRAVEANAKYWALLRQIGYETGHSANFLHKLYAEEFLGYKPAWDKETETWQSVPFSTAVLGGDEFSIYLEQVTAAGLEIGAELIDESRVR